MKDPFSMSSSILRCGTVTSIEKWRETLKDKPPQSNHEQK